MPSIRKTALPFLCLVLLAGLAWTLIPDGQRLSAPRPAAGIAERHAPSAAATAPETEAPLPPGPASVPVALKEAPPAEALPLPDDFLKRILSADGKTVTVSLPGGGTAKGRVSTLRRDADGPQFIEGTVTEPEAGRFMFQRQTVEGKAGSLVGFILLDKGDTAWQVRPVGEKGKPVLVKTTADAVICRALPAPDAPDEIPPTHPDNYPIPPDENGVIQLQSLPGATAVVYLDFDGEEGNFPSWGYINAQPSGATNPQIYDVWKGVSEDYQPFRINITTVRAVYDAAPEGRRMHVVVTPTTTAAPGAGGVAYVGSFNWSGEMVCWSFYGTGKNGVEVISHEVGHTLGLLHDGRTVPSEAYYLGHSGWAPIMGAGYYQTPSQWSKGEYPNANNTEDDLAIIATNNGVSLRTDDHGAAFASATWLEVTAAGEVSNEGVIETAADEDAFRFSTTGGALNLNINNVAAYPNLDLMAEILDSNGTVVAAHDPSASMDAFFSNLNLPAGDYFLRVSGVGRGDLATGYSDYASLGSYTITGTITGGVHADRFTIAENSANTSPVGTVAPRADHGAGVLSFAIDSGNTGGTFAIDPATGAITVADNTLLDFETLSTRWDDPATFELFVSITDSLGATAESIRTVVTVSDANEPPVFNTPPAVMIPEQLTAGTLVTKVSAADPDRSDHVTYSITGGNAGNAFAVNPATGAITSAGALNHDTTPSYTLTLRATDNLTPANFVEVPLTINLMDIAPDYKPGTVIRTFYNGIAGSTLAALTTNANFPTRPHSEAVLASFDSGSARGDSYGSTVRGYLIAPATGNYTFWISADDAGELLLSTDTNPANAVPIASVSYRTDPGVWTAYAGQQSAPVFLTAGQAYYIEARHKEDIEGDHVQVAWDGPGITAREIIPGRWLSPYQENYAPWSPDLDLVVRESANNGQRIGQVSFIEPDIGQTAAGYSITAGNAAGIFAVNAFSGDITVANGAALVVGSTHTLTISTSDNGIPPTAGTATVTIHVLGLHEQLHAWWKLDESAGITVNDSSGNSRHAGLSGGGSWIVRGAANRALQLNGASARFSYLGNNSLAGATSFTAAAWVKVPATHSADGVLIQQQESGGTGHIGRYIVNVKADGKVNFSLYGRDANNANEAYQFDITSSTSIKDGTWHHVACVRDGTTGRIFIDGVQRASASGPVRQLDPVLTVAVGYDARNSNQYLDAAVDDVRIYADALGGQQLVRVAGTPKAAIASPLASSVDIPAGVGILLQAVGSDPNGTTPVFTWSQVGGPGTVTFGSPAAADTTARFSMPGYYLLRATASDGVNTASADVGVTSGAVTGSNLGPLVSAGPDFSAVVNIASPLTGSVSDDGLPLVPGTTSLTWSAVSGPAPVTFGDAGLADTTATFPTAGDYVLRLVADDGAVKTFDETTASASLVDTISVTASDADAAETGTDPGAFTVTRGGSLVGNVTVNLEVTGTATADADYVSLPSSVVIPEGATTATFTVTPVPDALVEGPETVTLTATPGPYDITTASADVVIMDSNHAPAWTSSPITGTDATEDSEYAGSPLTGLAADPDGNPLVYSKTSGPAWLVVASDGSLSGTPGASDLGSNIFGVRVTDTGGLTADAVLEVFVHFNNQAPAFIADPVTAAAAMADIPYVGQSLAPSATDPDIALGDTLTFSKVGGPMWLDVAPDGSLSGTPQAADAGPNTFNVRVSDMAGASADVTLQITVLETTLYLDANGSAAGSGGPSSLTWDASGIWSADPDGAAATLPWIAGARAVLSAGADAVATTITVDGTQSLGGLTVEDGNPLLTGGMLLLAETATPFHIAAVTEVASGLAGAGTGIIKTGAGTLLLSGSNTYDGDTVIQNGVLELGASGKLYNTGPVSTAVITVESGGTWRLPDFSYAGVGQLTEERGRRVMDGGTIEVTGGSHVSSQNFTVTAGGGTFRYTAAGQTLALLGNTADNILVDGPLVIDAAGDITISEVLEGTGSIVKTGAGRLEFASAMAFTGTTAITQGTLSLSGSLAGDISVAAGATLAGGGSASGNAIVSGTIAPGDGVGTLTTGPLVLQTGARIEWQAGNWTGAAGTGSDLVSAASLDLTGASSVTLALRSEALANFTDAPASFTLVQAAAPVSGFDADHFLIDATAFPQATGHWSVRSNGNDLVLDYTPLSPFEAWQIAEFGPDAGNPAISGDAADPDGDGFSNLLEYSLATDPNLPTGTTIVRDMVEISGTAYLRLTVLKNPAATDLTYTVETTGDPTDAGSWSAADTVIEENTATTLIVRDTLAGSRRFIRLRVTR